MTIYDIASEAKVSISSVSRYFNHPEKLSPACWKKIDDVLKRHSFVPNQIARDLVLNTMRTVGIMMNDMKYQRFATISSNLERAFFNLGYSTLFCNTGNDLGKVQQYLGMLSSKRIEALILLGSNLGRPDIVNLLAKYFPNIPVVAADLVVDLPNYYSVSIDHVFGIEIAVDHLISRGHEHLVFVACTESSNTLKKAKAFQEALSVRNLPFDKEHNIIHFPMDRCEELSLDFASILQSKNSNCSGIIFSHDMVAARAISSLRFYGHEVPQEFGIIGYDNSPFGLCCQPALTTIDTQLGTTARVMVNLINDIFIGKEVGNKISINPRLVIRGST